MNDQHDSYPAEAAVRARAVEWLDKPLPPEAGEAAQRSHDFTRAMRAFRFRTGCPDDETLFFRQGYAIVLGADRYWNREPITNCGCDAAQQQGWYGAAGRDAYDQGKPFDPNQHGSWKTGWIEAANDQPAVRAD